MESTGVPQIIISLAELFREKGLPSNPELYWQKSGDKVNLWVVTSLPEDSTITLLEEAEKILTAVQETQGTTRQRGEVRIAEQSHFVSVAALRGKLAAMGYAQYQG